MTTKQSNLINYCYTKGVVINNIEDYTNKDSVLKCTCPFGHILSGTVDLLLKTDFECIECLIKSQKNIKDTTPYFLSLDAATYVTGMSVFNKEGQVLWHQALSIDKRKDYFVRLEEIVNTVKDIIKKNNIQCVILEDIQYQQNPALFKKLAMLQGVIRYMIINVLHIELITAMADEWRAYNHIYGAKRQEQKNAAIERAKMIYLEDISEDEAESIFLGRYGIHLYYQNRKMEEE